MASVSLFSACNVPFSLFWFYLVVCLYTILCLEAVHCDTTYLSQHTSFLKQSFFTVMLGNVLFPASKSCWSSLTRSDLCCGSLLWRFIGLPSPENYVRTHYVHWALSMGKNVIQESRCPLLLLASPPGTYELIQPPVLIRISLMNAYGSRVLQMCLKGQ